MTAPLAAERGSAETGAARAVLQITDTHLLAPAHGGEEPGPRPSTLLGVDTAASFDAVLRQALSERVPEAVIASGDLAHEPEMATYRRCRALIEKHYQGPVLYLPGNHDLAEPLYRVLGTVNTLRVGNWDIIGFDTHADHRTEARFEEAARRALTRRLRVSNAEHVLLACHHHALPVGCPWLDKDRIPRGEEVLDSCTADPRVRGLVFGHVHQEVRTRSKGMSVLGTPSTCFQFEPRSDDFAIDRSEQTGRPGYRWLVLCPDGTLDSEVRRVTGYRLNIDLSDTDRS